MCVANTFRCKLAHKKAFFAVLTDERNASLFSDAERAIIRAHVPWTRVVGDMDTIMTAAAQRLLRLAEDDRDNARAEAERRVRRHRRDARLGDDAVGVAAPRSTTR